MGKSNSIFITLGTKGCAIPGIRVLPPRLRIGTQRPGPWQLGRKGHDPDLMSVCAWVSESELPSKNRTGEIEIHRLDGAVKAGRIVTLKNFSWTDGARQKKHVGVGYIPREFLDPSRIAELYVIAVESPTWQDGWIELKRTRNRDGTIRNESQFAVLPFKTKCLASFGCQIINSIELL